MTNLNIEYQLNKASNVNISIYDLNGGLVEKILDVYQTAGNHKLNWDAHSLASGMYIIKLNVGSISYSNNVILLK